MPSPCRHRRGLLALLLPVWTLPVKAAQSDTQTSASWQELFNREVDHRVEVPLAEQAKYFELLQQNLANAKVDATAAAAYLVVDRSPWVQMAFVATRSPEGNWLWLGATAVSTGKTGSFEHFVTPLGVYPHSLANPDYRAEGTYNANHIRGYGVRGMRVFDFGWQLAQRGWGPGGESRMRLQMHATDPRLLEARLGRVASEGCVRIPATLNVFLDHHGILDADYEQAAVTGKPHWVLRPDRQPIATPGRYLVILDSQRQARPAWAPAAGRP